MTDVVMPQMGESIVEGTLTKWLKKPGERVERDEPLFEISTDKVDTEIPSPSAGTLAEILVEEGQTVGINTVVARIEEGGAAAAKPKGSARPHPRLRSRRRNREPPAPAAVQPLPLRRRWRSPLRPKPAGPLSPLVRRMARENNIDLRRVRGTGAGGRITKQDVEAYLAARRPQPAAPAPAPLLQSSPPHRRLVRQPRRPPPASAGARAAACRRAGPQRASSRMSTMRQKIAEHMVLSQAHLARTSPPCTVWT